MGRDDVVNDMRNVVNDVVWGKNNVVRHRQRHGNVYVDVVLSGYDVLNDISKAIMEFSRIC